ncbi:MAG: hypothetical protein COA41_14360 [Sphingopyxis sp.]|nr:MAG: hypothetical protein COA41_14360 [Sphingopyxis sp.]
MGGGAAQVEELCISVNYTLSIILHNSDPVPIERQFPLFPLAYARPRLRDFLNLSAPVRTIDSGRERDKAARES